MCTIFYKYKNKLVQFLKIYLTKITDADKFPNKFSNKIKIVRSNNKSPFGLVLKENGNETKLYLKILLSLDRENQVSSLKYKEKKINKDYRSLNIKGY